MEDGYQCIIADQNMILHKQRHWLRIGEIIL